MSFIQLIIISCTIVPQSSWFRSHCGPSIDFGPLVIKVRIRLGTPVNFGVVVNFILTSFGVPGIHFLGLGGTFDLAAGMRQESVWNWFMFVINFTVLFSHLFELATCLVLQLVLGRKLLLMYLFKHIIYEIFYSVLHFLFLLVISLRKQNKEIIPCLRENFRNYFRAYFQINEEDLSPIAVPLCQRQLSLIFMGSINFMKNRVLVSWFCVPLSRFQKMESLVTPFYAVTSI